MQPDEPSPREERPADPAPAPVDPFRTDDAQIPPLPASEPIAAAAPPAALPAPEPIIALPPATPIVQTVEAVPVTAAESRARTIETPAVDVTITPSIAATSAPAASTAPAAATTSAPAASSSASVPPDVTRAATEPSIPSSVSEPLPPIAPPPPVSAPHAAPPPPPSPPAPTGPPRPSPWQRRKQFVWAILCHLMMILVIPTVFLGMAITFLIWQLKGKNDRLVEDQGREALNFQINVAGLAALLGITCLAAPLIPLVYFVSVIMAIVAARHASDGEIYRYPWVLRIVTH